MVPDHLDREESLEEDEDLDYADGAMGSFASAGAAPRDAMAYIPGQEEIDLAIEALDARMEGTNGRRIAPFTPPRGSMGRMNLPGRIGGDRLEKETARANQRRASTPGTRRRTNRQVKQDMPPIPRGCEWRRADEGWSLWRTWGEWDEGRTTRVKKTRYAGHLSDEAWRILKEYDHETFLSVIGHRFRRYGRG
ncbi:MAG: hypothetical protein SF339_02765 [Blastocatellia bacterium]|nr:hypothetical protein [Blastocatellia bacterium]